MTGAVAASSRRLAHAMTEGIGLERARIVAELGPGTGVFTDAILARLAPDARVVAVELNPVLAARLSDTRRDTRLTVVQGSAAELAAAVGEPVDAVVSGLPWTVMPPSRRGYILDAVTEVLAPGGRFTTFAYLHAAWTPPARHLAAELACRDYLTLYERPFTVLRLGIPYGPRMRESTVLASLFRRALAGEPLRIEGDGRQVRNFVYIEDLARAFVLALDGAAENQTINIDGPDPVSIRELVELTGRLVPGTTVEFVPARPGDLSPRVVISERAGQLLGWHPAIDIAEGVRRTFEWYVGARRPADSVDA
jgi:nucleoside-diphosphate-sugar epimerase